MKLHHLDPLLRPRSIAVIGASERKGTVGSEVMLNLQRGGYEGALYPINPGRDSVHGLPCHASLADLPETVEQVIFAVADARIEAALDESILHGARAATIYSTLVLEHDTSTRPARAHQAESPPRRNVAVRRQWHGLLQFPRRHLGLRF